MPRDRSNVECRDIPLFNPTADRNPSQEGLPCPSRKTEGTLSNDDGGNGGMVAAHPQECLPHSKARWRHLPPASFSLSLSLKREMEAHTTTLPLNASLTQTQGGGALPSPPPSSQCLPHSKARWRHLPPASFPFPLSLKCEMEALTTSLLPISSLARMRDGGTYHHLPSHCLPRSNARRRCFATTTLPLDTSPDIHRHLIII